LFNEPPVKNSDIIHDYYDFHDLAAYGGAKAQLILPWMEGNSKEICDAPWNFPR
jgi:hypothetical protein